MAGRELLRRADPGAPGPCAQCGLTQHSSRPRRHLEKDIRSRHRGLAATASVLAVISAQRLDTGTLEVVSLTAVFIAVLGLGVALVALARLRVMTRQVRRLGAGGRGGAVDGSALRHVGVVHYDAFQEMGGRLSFSAALFDDRGDGVVLSSINGRSETRTYAKTLVAGSSEHELSPEEKQAIARARQTLS